MERPTSPTARKGRSSSSGPRKRADRSPAGPVILALLRAVVALSGAILSGPDLAVRFPHEGLRGLTMRKKLNVLIGVVALTAATSASADITLYRGEGFRGSAVRFDRSVRNLHSTPFASSAWAIVIDSGAWQVCDRPDFEGNCVIVRAGSYDSTRPMGLDGIVSAREAVTTHVQYREIPPPMAQPNYDYYQRPPEPVYEAPVRSVRAILGPPEQRCWVERE